MSILAGAPGAFASSATDILTQDLINMTHDVQGYTARYEAREFGYKNYQQLLNGTRELLTMTLDKCIGLKNRRAIRLSTDCSKETAHATRILNEMSANGSLDSRAAALVITLIHGVER